MSHRAAVCALAVLSLFLWSPGARGQWQAGVAQAEITPQQPMWMSGYASRDRPAEGKLHDLYARALALDDGQGHKAVLITMDLCGIDRDLSVRVVDRIAIHHRLTHANIALNVSHTHTGPVVGNNLRAMYFLDEKQNRLVNEYTRTLEDKLVQVAADALRSMQPVRLEYAVGKATFAVNRRNNKEEDVPLLKQKNQLKGPVDHEVPVLAVRPMGDAGYLALVFGYACHATTLSFYQWSGDWPAFARMDIEKRMPGTMAFFLAGCGADQNPLPRRTVELADQYGKEASFGVEQGIKKGLATVNGPLRTAYAEIALPYAAVPTREQLDKDATSTDRYVANRAKLLLTKLEREGRLKPNYPNYPVQVWKFGEDLTLVMLGGEVVVDYALRLKKELPEGKTWVAGYSNDVMAYIPSERVLKEGGYEGGGAMVYYGLPSPWAPGVEDLIVKKVHALVESEQ
jgi:hypothetical protein